MTIRIRLAITYAATLAVSLFLVGAVVWWQQGAAARTALDERLSSELDDLAQAVLEGGPSAILEAGDEPDVVFVAVLDGSGQRIAEVPGTPHDLVGPIPAGVTDLQLEDGPYALHVRPISAAWVGVAGASLRPLEDARGSLARIVLATGTFAAGLSLLTGWWLAGRALAPVDELTDEAAAIGSSDLARRLPVGERHDELTRLATTLNGMLDRIQGGVLRQRAFLAAASHDLRTPITALQTELELVDHPGSDAAELRAAITAARADIVRLGDLTTGLLDLVSAEPDGRALALSSVPLDEVVASVIDHVRPLASARDVTFRVDVPRLTIQVDRVRLEHALRNVVVNAVTYSPDGSTVDILGHAQPEDGGTTTTLTIDILDHGPGISSSESDLVFEPFVRGSRAIGVGSGLGLAAARAAVEAHRGSLVATARPGGGTVMSLQISV